MTYDEGAARCGVVAGSSFKKCVYTLTDLNTAIQLRRLAMLFASLSVSALLIIGCGFSGTVVPPSVLPTVTNLSPATAVAGSPAFSITVTGTEFSSGTAINWNGTNLSTTFVSSTALQATVSENLLASPATVMVGVVKPDNSTSNKLPFIVAPPAVSSPTLTSINPNGVVAGSAGFTLVATGSNFVSGSQVTWNGSGVTSTFVSATEVDATIPASLVASFGTANVGVTNPGGLVSNTLPFSIASPAPQPATLASISPNSAVVGSAGFTLVATGTNFTDGTEVLWNDVAVATTLVSSTELDANIPASLIAAVGSARVSVQTPDGLTTDELPFSITPPANQAPILVSISPNYAVVGSAGFTLTAIGVNFVSGSQIAWNGVAMSTTYLSATELQASVPTSSLTSTSVAKVTVINPNGLTSGVVNFVITSNKGPVSTVPYAGGLYFYHQIVLTTSSPLPITVINNQSIALAIKSITSTVDYPFTTDCVGSGGTGRLAASASCTISVSFYPQALGVRSGAIIISHNASGSPISVPLTGTGIAGDPGITVTVSPQAPCLTPQQTQQFSAIVTGTTNTAVAWYVNSVPNGNSSIGTITNSGLFTAPTNPQTSTIKAVSQASTTVVGRTVASTTTNPGFGIYPYTSSIPPSGQQTFQPQICQVPDTGPVSWTVDNVAGGNATVGTVTSAGIYTAPAAPGKHTVRVTDLTLNKTSGAVVNVFSNLSIDFGSRTDTTYPLPANMFGYGRGESIQSQSDRNMLTAAGVTSPRFYSQIPMVYATQTPDWTKVDPLLVSMKAAGQHPIVQLSLTPVWLQPTPNPCGTGNTSTAPADVQKWGQIAASYVAHIDAEFPGLVQDYEIWNEPNSTGMCAKNHLETYLQIFGAAAPLMKQQAAADGATIHVGGPVLSGFSSFWLSAFLTDPRTAPYVDFVSYHQYMFGEHDLEVQWDSYTATKSLYQQTQDPSNGAAAIYSRVYGQIAAGSQPLGLRTPIYISEFNTNWSFYKDCCRNDPTYAPVWNALFTVDLLNGVYSGIPAVPTKLVYFAGSAYPYFCLIGMIDQGMDCGYSSNATVQPYPQYYAYQLLSSTNFLGLVNGGYLATSVTPPTGGGGLAVSAFYNAGQDSVIIVNPTGVSYSQVPVSLLNVGFATPTAMFYQIVNGASINSSSLALSPQGSGFSATINVPPYSVQGISLKGN